MKKIILSISVLALLTACGSGSKKKDAPTTDTTKKDTTTTVVDNKPKVKDYAYYRDQFKAIKIDGVTLEQYNMYEDTANKTINLIYTVKNPADAGYDEVILQTSVCNYTGEDQNKCKNWGKETFEYFTNYGAKKKDIVTVSEYKSGETMFYYATHKNIKGTMGGKDFNQMSIQTKSGEIMLDGKVNVYDLKSDMVKAEAGLKKIADYMAK